MTFTEREKFIYHATTLMTMDVCRKRDKSGKILDVKRLLEMIRNNRCRKLSDDNIGEIYNDLEEEVLLSTSVYDMAEETKKNSLGRFFRVGGG